METAVTNLSDRLPDDPTELDLNAGMSSYAAHQYNQALREKGGYGQVSPSALKKMQLDRGFSKDSRDSHTPENGINPEEMRELRKPNYMQKRPKRIRHVRREQQIADALKNGTAILIGNEVIELDSPRYFGKAGKENDSWKHCDLAPRVPKSHVDLIDPADIDPLRVVNQVKDGYQALDFLLKRAKHPPSLRWNAGMKANKDMYEDPSYMDDAYNNTYNNNNDNITAGGSTDFGEKSTQMVPDSSRDASPSVPSGSGGDYDDDFEMDSEAEKSPNSNEKTPKFGNKTNKDLPIVPNDNIVNSQPHTITEGGYENFVKYANQNSQNSNKTLAKNSSIKQIYVKDQKRALQKARQKAGHHTNTVNAYHIEKNVKNIGQNSAHGAYSSSQKTVGKVNSIASTNNTKNDGSVMSSPADSTNLNNTVEKKLKHEMQERMDIVTGTSNAKSSSSSAPAPESVGNSPNSAKNSNFEDEEIEEEIDDPTNSANKSQKSYPPAKGGDAQGRNLIKKTGISPKKPVSQLQRMDESGKQTDSHSSPRSQRSNRSGNNENSASPRTNSQKKQASNLQKATSNPKKKVTAAAARDRNATNDVKDEAEMVNDDSYLAEKLVDMAVNKVTSNVFPSSAATTNQSFGVSQNNQKKENTTSQNNKTNQNTNQNKVVKVKSSASSVQSFKTNKSAKSLPVGKTASNAKSGHESDEGDYHRSPAKIKRVKNEPGAVFDDRKRIRQEEKTIALQEAGALNGKGVCTTSLQAPKQVNNSNNNTFTEKLTDKRIEELRPNRPDSAGTAERKEKRDKYRHLVKNYL